MNAQIRAEASEWLIEWRTDVVDPAGKERFTQWLRSSPEHVRAYLELTAFWEDASLFDSDRRQEIEQLIEQARAESNIVALDAAHRSEPDARPVSGSGELDFHRRFRRYLLAAAASVALVGVSAWIMFLRAPGYSTELGEQRSILLSDGSSLELNALSSIRVRYSDRERLIELLEGQALFRVAVDKNRPFIVASGDTRVRAVGTQFDVNRRGTGTIVTVVEGRVAVQPRKPSGTDGAMSSAGSRAIELGAGEQLTVTSASAPASRTANIITATAWTQQQLIFESLPLPEVAEEFNRFNARKLIVETPALEGFHVSGTFSAVDPSSLPRFLSFLRDQPGIELSESGDRIVVTKK